MHSNYASPPTSLATLSVHVNRLTLRHTTQQDDTSPVITIRGLSNFECVFRI